MKVEDAALLQKLKFAFTAILPRASRRYQWSAQRPLNAQNQTYYIAPVYYEWNVFELFGRKIEAAIRADEVLYRGQDTIHCAPPRRLSITISPPPITLRISPRSRSIMSSRTRRSEATFSTAT